jgi:hypothetical protein
MTVRIEFTDEAGNTLDTWAEGSGDVLPVPRVGDYVALGDIQEANWQIAAITWRHTPGHTRIWARCRTADYGRSA